MAFANSGDVLHVQKMLHTCTEHLDEAEATHQAVAVLGIGMIAMGEDRARWRWLEEGASDPKRHPGSTMD